MTKTQLYLVIIASSLSGNALAVEPTTNAEESVLVLPTQSQTLAEVDAQRLANIILAMTSPIEGLRVISTSDLNAVLSAEKLKDTLGCADVVCASEIGGALGVRFLITSTAEQIADEILVSLSLIDARSAQIHKRESVRLESDNATWLEPMSVLIASIWDHNDPTALLPHSSRFRSRHFVGATFIWDQGGWNAPGGDAYAGESASTVLAGAEYRWQHAPLLSLSVTVAGGETSTYYGSSGSSTTALYASVSERVIWPLVQAADERWVGCEQTLVGPYAKLGVDFLYGASDGYGDGTLQYLGGVAEAGMRLFWMYVAVRGGLQGALSDQGSNRQLAHWGISTGLEWGF